MSNIKNDQILLYFHFNKIIKGPRTSFQSPALTQNHFRNASHTGHQYFTKFPFDSTQESKRNKRKCKFHYVAMPMMTSQISKSMSFTEAQTSRYLENETLLFIQIKKNIHLVTHHGMAKTVLQQRQPLKLLKLYSDLVKTCGNFDLDIKSASEAATGGVL